MLRTLLRARLPRLAALLALGVLLHGSNCRVQSGDGVRDGDDGGEEDEDDEQRVLVLPPRLDPLGRSLGGPTLVDAAWLRPAH